MHHTLHSDLEEVPPHEWSDWSETPPSWLSELSDRELSHFGVQVHSLWKLLYRQVSESFMFPATLWSMWCVIDCVYVRLRMRMVFSHLPAACEEPLCLRSTCA